VPSCSDAGIDSLLASSSDGTAVVAAAEGTASDTASDADADAGAGDLS
jgi:hypothetical protein